MELSSKFLMVLGNEQSADSVKKALDACNLEMMQRMGKFEDEKEVIDTFFKDENDLNSATKAFYEMMNFKNVCEKYLYMLTEEDKQNIWILQIAEEAEGVYQVMKNKMLLSNMTEIGRDALDSLCNEIEGISDALSISFMVAEKSGLVIKSKIALDEFQEKLLSFTYVKVQNQIIETMQTGGIAFVTAGLGKNTTQNIYEFILFENGWIKVNINITLSG